MLHVVRIHANSVGHKGSGSFAMMVPMFRTASADGSPGRDGHSSISVLVESDVPSLTSLLVDEEEDRTSRTEDENGDHAGLEQQSQPVAHPPRGIHLESGDPQQLVESRQLSVSVRLPLSDQIVLLQRIVRFWYGRDLNQTTLSDGSHSSDDDSSTHSNNSINHRNKNRCTPLMEAAKYGREECVYVILLLQYFLLLKSSQRKQQNQHQIQSILHQIRISLQLTIWEGHEHIVRLLLLVGKPPSSRRTRDAMDGSQVCDTLKRLYCETLRIHSTCDILQFDMLAIAIVQCNYPIIHLLLGELYRHSKSDGGGRQQPLGGKDTTVSILQHTDEFGRTILHLALMSCGDITIIQKILKCCPSLLHIADSDLRTPLQYAIANQDKVKVRYLLDLGAKVNIATTETAATVATSDANDDDSISSPLHMAACYPVPSIVKSLLQCGADYTQRDVFGRTPFIVACAHGHVAVVQMFISKCCKKKNHGAGNTPMKNQDFLDYTSTIFGSPEGDTNHSGYLDINEPDFYGQTPLHYAIMESHIGVAQLLLQYGADVNVQTYPSDEAEQGEEVESCLWTPLHIASYWGCIEIVQLLFDYGAGLTIKNQAGETPIDVARRNNQLQTINLILNFQESQEQKLLETEFPKQQRSRGRIEEPEQQSRAQERRRRSEEEKEGIRSEHHWNHDEMMEVLSSLL